MLLSNFEKKRKKTLKEKMLLMASSLVRFKRSLVIDNNSRSLSLILVQYFYKCISTAVVYKELLSVRWNP